MEWTEWGSGREEADNPSFSKTIILPALPESSTEEGGSSCHPQCRNVNPPSLVKILSLHGSNIRTDHRNIYPIAKEAEVTGHPLAQTSSKALEEPQQC